MSRIKKEIIRSMLDNELHLILLPTEACNFRCVYCYESFAYGRMEPWVVQGVKNLISSRVADLDQLKISWFGGEPLLALDIIESILEHTRGLRTSHPRIQFHSDVTTNAYGLSRDVFARLLDLGVVLYQISFDGPREWHDRKRVQANGAGTYDRIWSNLCRMKEVDRPFTVIVRLHADQDNCAALPQFIDEFAGVFGEDARFSLFIRELSRLGGPNDHKLNVFGPEQSAPALASLKQHAGAHQVKQMQLDPSTDVCYAARANSFVVRANGRLNKCTVALEHPANQVGRLFEDGHVEVTKPQLAGWMRGLFSGDQLELICPLIGYAEPVAATAATPPPALMQS